MAPKDDIWGAITPATKQQRQAAYKFVIRDDREQVKDLFRWMTFDELHGVLGAFAAADDRQQGRTPTSQQRPSGEPQRAVSDPAEALLDDLLTGR